MRLTSVLHTMYRNLASGTLQASIARQTKSPLPVKSAMLLGVSATCVLSVVSAFDPANNL